jgi:hypothetical protein
LAAEVKDGEVAIPNKLLMSGAQIYCWAFAEDVGGAYTKQEQTLEVIKRAKPSDYVYTETEVITIQTVVKNALQEAKESGELKGAFSLWHTSHVYTDDDIEPTAEYSELELYAGAQKNPDEGDFVEDDDGDLFVIIGVDGTTFRLRRVNHYDELSTRITVLENDLGQIDAVLDSIIAIQNSLIGGDAK